MDAKLPLVKAAFDKVCSAAGYAKEQVIREVCADEYIKRAIILQANPTITFGFGKKKLYKQVTVSPRKTHDDLLSLCEYMYKQKSISDWHIASAQEYIRSQPEELQAFASAYIAKKIAIGALAKTINAALGEEVIKNFNCMLANKYADRADKVKGKEFYVTEKLDGLRCLAFITPEKIELYSRQGFRLYGFVEIEEELAPMKSAGVSVTLDGEILCTDRENLPSKDQFIRTVAAAHTHGVKKGLTYHVFDIMNSSLDKLPYAYRRTTMENIVPRSEHVTVVPVLYAGRDQMMIPMLLEEQIALRHEGVMINLADEPYHYRRTDAILKCKPMNDCDLRIVGVEEGDGKYTGSLGAIVVEYKGSTVHVGSGFTDEERAEIWADPDAYIGRIAVIQYFEETNDSSGKPSLRFPVYKGMCEPGREVSYS